MTHWAPAADLAQQLEILRHQLALVALEGRDDAADEEVGLGQRFDGRRCGRGPSAPRSSTAAGRSGPPNRGRRPARPGRRSRRGIVAGDGQDVVEAFARRSARRRPPGRCGSCPCRSGGPRRWRPGRPTRPASQSGGSIGPPPGLSVIEIQPIRGSASRPGRSSSGGLTSPGGRQTAGGDHLRAVVEAAAARASPGNVTPSLERGHRLMRLGGPGFRARATAALALSL